MLSRSSRAFLLSLVLALGVSLPTVCKGEEPPAEEGQPSVTEQKLERTRAILQNREEEQQGSGAGAAWLSSPKSESASSGSFSKLFQGIFLCFGFLAIGSGLFRRFRKRNTSGGERRIQVVERVALTPKAALCLVRVNGKEILLATGQDQVRLLHGGSDARSSTKGQESPSSTFDSSLDLVCKDDVKLTA